MSEYITMRETAQALGIACVCGAIVLAIIITAHAYMIWTLS